MTQNSKTYRVVVNDEGQYSIMQSNMTLPGGWRECSITGSKFECLEYIDKNWRDLLPRSVREQLKSGT